MYDTESSRWRAVQTRDKVAASSFVYAVISTKIYCRPGCPSRLARRANVCFYDSAVDAASMGYRPCLRCKPDQTTFNLDSQDAHRKAVMKACEYIEETEGKAKFAEVAKHVGLSTRYLYALFQAVLATTPAKYAAGLKSPQTTRTRSDIQQMIPDTFNALEHETFKLPADSFVWSTLLNPEYVEFTVSQENRPLSSCDLLMTAVIPATYEVGAPLGMEPHKQVDQS